MGPAAAVRTELLRSFDLKGRTTRAAYLWFLSTSILALAAGIWACHALLPDDQVIRGVCAVIALFYLPVTAAGVRRLHDVGASGLLMLEPLKPGLGLGTALWLLWLLATGTLVGTTSVILATLFFPAVVVAPWHRRSDCPHRHVDRLFSHHGAAASAVAARNKVLMTDRSIPDRRLRRLVLPGRGQCRLRRPASGPLCRRPQQCGCRLGRVLPRLGDSETTPSAPPKARPGRAPTGRRNLRTT
jgi:uncharacterized membrane protein YhaH (DUF805 family)